MEKYSDDGIAVYDEIPKEDAHEAAVAWGEGLPELEQLIENVILQDGIQSVACCAGHEEDEIPDAYIAFKSEGEKVLQILSKICDNKKCVAIRFLSSL